MFDTMQPSMIFCPKKANFCHCALSLSLVTSDRAKSDPPGLTALLKAINYFNLLLKLTMSCQTDTPLTC